MSAMHATRARLADGRWHFQHGPIDLVIGAEGEPGAVEAAHGAAWARFQTVLPELVAELRTLRLPVRGPCPLQGVVARRMWLACRPFHSQFITPMAAVAGAVAQEIVPAYERPGIDRAWVNNGGDIALHLAPGASVKVGLFADLARFDPADGAPRLDGNFTVTADLAVRGIATSGWRGRSFSLGIADSVTVLARTAAMADAAATVIGNAVNVDDSRIARRPACELKDDSDLRDLPVTVAVPPLPPVQVQAALQAGAARARALQRDGLIHSALLVCQHRALGVEATAPGELPSAAKAVGSVFA
ncbi:Thiamine biosynthesis protein ApbE OS=Rhizobacter sp. Root404 OX=1736528 GN=ASC76_23770 PE=4 SV=1 [Rhizobacter fulvus]